MSGDSDPGVDDDCIYVRRRPVGWEDGEVRLEAIAGNAAVYEVGHITIQDASGAKVTIEGYMIRELATAINFSASELWKKYLAAKGWKSAAAG